jgi:hypothetical protein
MAQQAASQKASSQEVATWELSDRIDARFVLQHGPMESWPMASDTEFLRRVYLDLTGRNPTPAEVRRFLEDDRPDKRRLWIDSLIQSTAFSARLADSWTRMLVGEGRISAGLTDRSRRHLRTWLMQRFAANQRYDRVVADLLMSKGEGEVSPIAFFVAQEFQPEKLAEKSSPNCWISEERLSPPTDFTDAIPTIHIRSFTQRRRCAPGDWRRQVCVSSRLHVPVLTATIHPGTSMDN